MLMISNKVGATADNDNSCSTGVHGSVSDRGNGCGCRG